MLQPGTEQCWEWKHFPAHLQLSLVYLRSDPWCCMLLITAAWQGDFPNKAELSFHSLPVIIHLCNTSMACVRALLATFSCKDIFPVVQFKKKKIVSALFHTIVVAMVDSAAELYGNLHLQERNLDLTVRTSSRDWDRGWFHSGEESIDISPHVWLFIRSSLSGGQVGQCLVSHVSDPDDWGGATVSDGSFWLLVGYSDKNTHLCLKLIINVLSTLILL